MCPSVTRTLSVINESQIMRKCAGWLEIGRNVNSDIQSSELLLEFHFLILKVRKTENY